MGWTYTSREKGIRTLDYFSDLFSGPQGQVIDCAATTTEAYLAWRDARTGHITAIVCDTRWVPNDPMFNFGYKAVEETCGPVIAACPAKILDMLTPVDEAYPQGGSGADAARAWRQACRDRLERRAEVRVKTGDVVEFNSPLQFTDGTSYRRLIFEKGTVFRPADRPWLRVRVRGWRDLPLSVAAAHQ